MNACQTVFRIVVLIVYLTFEGIDVQVTYAEVNNIHDINASSAVFECNKRAIVRCYGPKYSFINWQINSSVSIGTSLSAQCFAGFECDVFNNFSGRYSFEYNSSTGISDLTISPVSLQDNGMEYKCSDRPEPPLKAAVRNFLGNHSYTLQNGTSVDRSNILLNLTIDCTAEYVNITWYSRAKNGTDYRIHKATLYTESECLAGSCIEPGKSKIISSLLELVIVTDKKQRRKREVGDGRVFGCSITSDSWNLSIPIQGTYTLKETYNVSSPSSNNTPPTTFKTTPYTVNNTTTEGMPKSYLPVIIGSVCGVLAFLAIIIVIALCCSRRSSKKAINRK